MYRPYPFPPLRSDGMNESNEIGYNSELTNFDFETYNPTTTKQMHFKKFGSFNI